MTDADATLRDEWEDQADDPEPADLGYEMVDFEVLCARKSGTKRLMFLPDDEELLRRDAFIVADVDAVVDLEDRS